VAAEAYSEKVFTAETVGAVDPTTTTGYPYRSFRAGEMLEGLNPASTDRLGALGVDGEASEFSLVVGYVFGSFVLRFFVCEYRCLVWLFLILLIGIAHAQGA
jgi:hypothetical protein